MKAREKLANLFQNIILIAKYQFRTFAITWSAAPTYLLLSAALTLVEAAVPFGQIWVGKMILDKVVATASVVSSGGQPNLRVLFILLALQFVLWTLREASESLSQPTRALLAEQVNHRMEMLLVEKAASVELLWYEHPEFQNQLANARRAASGSTLPLHNIFAFFHQIVSLVIAIGLLARLHVAAPLIVCVFLIPHIIFRIRFSRASWQLNNEQTSIKRMVSYLHNLLVLRKDAKEVRIFGLKNFLLERYRQLREQIFQQDKKFLMSRYMANILAGCAAALGAAVVYAYVVYEAAYQRITLGDLMLYIQITGQVQMYFLSLLSQFSHVYETGLEQMHFYRFLDLDAPSSAVKGDDEQIPLQSFPVHLSKGIECKHVWFQYPGDVNLTFRPGEKVALVGENGAGKTTLAMLIVGLYQATRGSIRIEGHDIAEYNQEELSRHFSVIFQDFSRYNLTARENIGFGSIEHLDDKERIVTAARKAGADVVIDRLKAGYETYLGRQFEGATDLSGGEWQKIALTRAFMRDAQVLILDEPTASLDVRAEYEMYRHIGEITSGKIVLFISHRFSTVKMADRILVLENGIITEDGSHSELIAKGGTYAKMYRLQAERYGM